MDTGKPQTRTIEELEKALAAVEKERDELKTEVSNLKGSVYNGWPLHSRVPLKKILKSNDSGISLIGTTIAVAGWVRTVRMAQKDTLAFVKINDGSCFSELQLVVNERANGWESIKNHTAGLGASIFAVGEITKSLGEGQPIELLVNEFRLLGPADPLAFPLAGKKEHSLEFLRTIGHLRPRTQLISSISRIRNCLAFATHSFFQHLGYYYVNTPIITASDCEGAGEMFQVTNLFPKDNKVSGIPTVQGEIDFSKDFFKKPSFLTVSGQLNGELYATAMGSIYTFGPTFRAEDSNTGRHLAEFWMIEPEIAFADLFENMNIAEQYVKYTLSYALEQCPEEFNFLEAYEKKAVTELAKAGGLSEEEKAKKKAELAAKKALSPEEKKAQAEAAKAAGLAKKAELAAQKKDNPEADNKEPAKPAAKTQPKKIPVKQLRHFKSVPLRERLTSILNSKFARVTYTEAVQLLLDSGVEFEVEPYWGLDLGSEHERWLAEQHFKCPVICYNYPKEFKAFYMRLNSDGKTVAAMDVLVPGMGELIGGSQREERLDVLLAMLKEKGLDEKPYSWYLDTRRFGSVVHSGFGTHMLYAHVLTE